MPLFSLSWTLLVPVIGCAVLVGFVLRRGRRTQAAVPLSHWRVVTDSTVKFVESSHGYYGAEEKINVGDTVQVRVTRGKKATLLVATVPIGADDFEEQISDAQAKAAEKAAALNAYVGSAA